MKLCIGSNVWRAGETARNNLESTKFSPLAQHRTGGANGIGVKHSIISSSGSPKLFHLGRSKNASSASASASSPSTAASNHAASASGISTSVVGVQEGRYTQFNPDRGSQSPQTNFRRRPSTTTQNAVYQMYDEQQQQQVKR